MKKLPESPWMQRFCFVKVLLVAILLATGFQVRSDEATGYLQVHDDHQSGKIGLVYLHDQTWKTTRKLQQQQQQDVQQEAEEINSKRDVRLAIILGSFSALIALIVCGPMCCICYGAKRIRDMRRKAAATHSHIFAEQWRAHHLFMPFDEDEELGQAALSWPAWQFVHRGIPEEFNGLSTAIFQTIPPVSGSITTSPTSTSAALLQQIRINPGCARLRRSQALQCLLPLLPPPQFHHPTAPDVTENGNSGRRLMLPYVSYFEMSILSFCRNGNRGRSSGLISGRVAIGLAARPSPPFRLPGLDMVSLGYHSNGCIFINEPHDGVHVSRRWNLVGATVGCGFDLDKCLVYFTLNGAQQIFTDFAFRADGSLPSTIPHLFPVVAADCDVTVVVNLGQSEFLFAAANATRCIAFLELNQQQQQQIDRQNQQQQQHGQIDRQQQQQRKNIRHNQHQQHLDMVAIIRQQEQPLLDVHRLQGHEQQQNRTSRSESLLDQENYYSASESSLPVL